MDWDRLRQLIAAALVGGFLGLVGGLMWPCPQPKAVWREVVPQKLKVYNLTFPDGTKTSWVGTHITSNGFCTTIWIDTVVDTNVCQAHTITEAYEGGQTPPETGENEQRS